MNETQKKPPVTRKDLADWLNEGKYPYPEKLCEDSSDYFRYTLCERDWADMHVEGRALWKIMFKQKFDDWSPAASVFYGVAAGSAWGAFSAVADAIGIDCEVLEQAVWEWYETPDKGPTAFPPPVGYDGLKKKIEEAQKEVEEWRQRERQREADLKAGKFKDTRIEELEDAIRRIHSTQESYDIENDALGEIYLICESVSKH